MSYQIFVVSELFILEQTLQITLKMFATLLQALTLASQQDVRLFRELDFRLLDADVVLLLAVLGLGANLGILSSAGISVGFVPTRSVSTRSFELVAPIDIFSSSVAFHRGKAARCFLDLRKKSRRNQGQFNEK